MAKKSISWILMAALVNYLIAGCTRTSEYKVLSEELDIDNSNYSEKIMGVVTKNGEKYNFEKPAFFSQSGYRIRGTLVNGSDYSISLRDKNLKEIRISRAVPLPVEQVNDKPIREIILKNYRGGEIAWEDLTWRYDTNKNELIGFNDNKILFQIAADSILELRSELPDTVSRSGLTANPDILVTELKVGKKIYVFNDLGGQLVKNLKSIIGETSYFRNVEIPVDDILYVNVERVDPAKTIIATLGGLILVGVVVVLIAAAAKQSCPFVYSFDGENYVFDAEPLGGAVSEGLKKYDFSRLEHIKDVNGQYTLLFRNEVKETQYLDHIRLLTIDHAPGTTIVPDMEGHFYQISEAVPATRYYDENGDPLDQFLSKNDDLIWQTFMPRGGDTTFRQNRHEIMMEFPVPPGTINAQLIFNGGTALWGSNMIREMLELRGDKLDEWYTGINNHGAKYQELIHFTLREELYLLHLYAKDGDKWRHINYIGGGGPLITEDRIIPMDLSWLKEDTLTLRISPPPGFWQIDYMAVSYNSATVSEINDIELLQAVDSRDKDVSASLRIVDNVYHEMPEVGDWYKVNFPTPEPVEGKQRSVFLVTNGFYELHIDKTRPEQTALIREILDTPGKIIDYSKKRYFEWTSELISSTQTP